MAMVRGRPALHAGLARRVGVSGRASSLRPSWSTWSSPTHRACWPSTARPGRLLVLTTTTPADLVTPFAESARLRPRRSPPATPASRRRYTGGIEGDFVWSTGKLAAVRRWAAASASTWRASHAYSDSVFDLPLLGAVGHPHAVNPDRRLNAVARVRALAGRALGPARRACPRWAGSSPTTCCARWCAPRCSPMPASTSTAWTASPPRPGHPRRQPPQLLRRGGAGHRGSPSRDGPCGSWPSASCSTRPSSARWRGPWAASPWTAAAAPTPRCATPGGPSRPARWS